MAEILQTTFLMSIFSTENVWIFIQISLKFIHMHPINSSPLNESCHDTDPAVTGGTGGCRLSPAVSPAPTMPAPCELSVLSEDRF